MSKKELKTIKLSKIAHVTQGQSPESVHYSDSEGVPFLQGNRTFGDLYPNYDTFTKKVTRLAREGEVLMSIRAPVGALNLAPSDLCIGRGLASIRALNGDNKFLYYALRYNVKNLIKQGGATTFDSVNKDIINNFELIIPEDSVMQGKVSNLLSTIDSKIELNNKINTELEAMVKTLYDYWFVQFDFPNVNGKPYKSSGGKMIWDERLKKEIPEIWISGKLEDFIDLNPETQLNTRKNACYIDMDALPEEGFMTKAVLKKDFSGGTKFTNGDVLIGRITPCLENGKTGLVTLLKDGESGFGSTEFIVMRGKKKISSFISLLARSELFRKYAITNMTGTSGRKRIDAKTLGKFKLCIPDNDTLDSFENIVGNFFDIMTNNTKENQELSTLRDWLLPMLMNGQVTVE